MTLKKEFDPESLKIKVKDDEVIIVLKTKKWNAAHTTLLETIADHAKSHGIPITDHVKHALELKAEYLSPTQKSYDRFMRLCDNLVAAEEKSQSSLNDDESLKIKVKDDEVIIALKTNKWSAAHTTLLETIADHAKSHGVPITDHVKHALELKAEHLSPTQKSYERFMRLCNNLVAAEEKSKSPPNDDVDPNAVELN